MRDLTALQVPANGQTMERAGARSRIKRQPDRGAELLAAIGIAVLFTVCGAVFICSGMLSSDRLYANIYVDGVDVGGKTLSEARGMFTALQETTPAGLQFTIDGKIYRITAEEVSARYNVKETLDDAWNAGRQGNTFRRLGEILSLRASPRKLSFKVLYDEARLRGAIDAIARENFVPARDAALQFLPDAEEAFVVTDEVVGRAVDGDELLEQLKARLDMRSTSALSFESRPAQPSITAESLRARTQLLGTFSTALTPEPVRNGNIKLAADAVNGVVLNPGEEFSFNRATGERTKAKGYQDAPTISGNQLVDAPGGGVCQVSTTIYNAALLSGMEIVERHHHTWPMSYVAVGLDATVDYGTKDLRLKNNTGQPVYLVFRVDEGKMIITAEFYGMPSKESISVVSDGYETVMPSAPVKISNGSKPIGWTRTIVESRIGSRVNIFRVFNSGTSSRRELVSEDFYPPIQGRIEIGTKAPSKKNK